MDIQYFASALQHNESLSLAFFGRQVVTADRAPPPPPPTYGTSMGNIPGSSAYTSPGIGPSPVSAPTGPPPPPLIKDIETITLYRKDGATSESEKVVATQRTATFLRCPLPERRTWFSMLVRSHAGSFISLRVLAPPTMATHIWPQRCRGSEGELWTFERTALATLGSAMQTEDRHLETEASNVEADDSWSPHASLSGAPRVTHGR